ncbi:hypothetical protein UA38_21980 [Photobacterium kishitanii]|uniref:Uncharacterized protein n=1 Tax=Photobacterium kishitanii TaxID=318456 RepID=A0AAX0YPF0_9GAMM|nr:hypothetical protein [Photobacterium kishitanii]KJG55011.1 hypothetical protein UA38_21980 [Photobacterium kishitanii]KJG56561.1 hypothetical protein UA42_22340 [Photobacterium kishitanii]KJG63368.1 hypothetical protein UA40_22330 [Photobacterium kishitanii]KJG65332.1 hypothetical protein UA41_22220 [Photobacterium kishitanii]PSU16339.1 hypothetical protein CTM84_19525 [Photobacterium kishitanii]
MNDYSFDVIAIVKVGISADEIRAINNALFNLGATDYGIVEAGITIAISFIKEANTLVEAINLAHADVAAVDNLEVMPLDVELIELAIERQNSPRIRVSLDDI